MYFGDSDRTGLPFAKDPSVVRFGGRYLMYYSIAAYTKERAPANAPKGWAIGIAESNDLVNWKKVGEILPEQDCEKMASSMAASSFSMASFTFLQHLRERREGCPLPCHERRRHSFHPQPDQPHLESHRGLEQRPRDRC
jgi:hypothetical protein